MRVTLHRWLSTIALSAIVFTGTAHAGTARTGIPTPDHVVIVLEENHGYNQIIGSRAAPYINALAAQGALFTHSYAIQRATS